MTIVTAPERVVILDNISWDTFERLLAEKRESNAPRYTYDRGMLEIMSPSPDHEIPNRTLAALVDILVWELRLDIVRAGSTTYKRGDLLKGFEPDSCFYIQHAKVVRGKRVFDLAVDPPPDLVIEVDITSWSLDRFPIFAAVGVPEVWRHDGNCVTIYALENGKYKVVPHSLVFPIVTGDVLTQFLAESNHLSDYVWRDRVRAWVHAQLAGE